MIRSVYEQVVLIDTSAVLALHDPGETFHAEARRLFSSAHDLIWAVLDATSHECFTRARYRGTYRAAIEQYSFLRDSDFKLLRFEGEDEAAARDVLERYSEHSISFHDALCAAVMKRIGIYRVFTFDRDFTVLGFETLPPGLAR